MKALALVRFHPIREVLNLFGSTAHEPGQALEICYLPKALRTASGPAPAGRSFGQKWRIQSKPLAGKAPVRQLYLSIA